MSLICHLSNLQFESNLLIIKYFRQALCRMSLVFEFFRQIIYKSTEKLLSRMGLFTGLH